MNINRVSVILDPNTVFIIIENIMDGFYFRSILSFILYPTVNNIDSLNDI